MLATPGQPFREGDYLVHAEVAPGRYVASNGPGCYWARVKDFSDPNGSSIIANARNVPLVDIAPTDFGFSSDHCGTWTFVGPPQPPPPVTTAPPPVDAQPPNAPVINLWYGTPETFGARGQPQTWDNVLGNVSDPVGIASLSYTLNGGPRTALSWGPNQVRLVGPGDFNVEIAATSLNVGANVVHIVATDLKGRQAVRDVVVNKVNGGPWPIPYTADWSTAGGNVNSLAQVVDGRWEIKPDGTLHNTQRGYDRTVAIGQASTWARYEVTAPITINAWIPTVPRSGSSPAGRATPRT